MSEILSADSQKWLQPSGLDITRYGEGGKWTNSRWAWEFLRRNPSYQDECQKAGNKASHSAVAQKFHLNRYKPYWEEFKSDEKGHKRAKFVTRNLIFWSCLEPLTKPPRTVKAKLKHGEILVRLPVWATAKLTDSSLPRLLASTGALAHVFLDAYLQLENLEKPKEVRDHIDGEFLPYLRVLDLEAYCASLSKNELADEQLRTKADRFLKLFGTDDEKDRLHLTGEADEFRNKYKAIKKKAIELVTDEYLHIAALDPNFPKAFRKKLKVKSV